MLDLAEPDVGKDRRPEPAVEKTERADGEATRQIRVFKDLADMLGEIHDMKDGQDSIANIVDPWLRPHVLAEHARLKELIDQMKKLREEAQKGARKPKKS